jgi:hypothetical protein
LGAGFTDGQFHVVELEGLDVGDDDLHGLGSFGSFDELN